jgi:site-specific DNA-methyltransferase (adenine-specific)/adenine-specific DNA-methyltransferase
VDYWLIDIVNQASKERTGYATQKPEKLIERIVRVSSSPGDLAADFFCGSGTLPAVATRLGRRWIACDSSASAIETAKQRLLAMDKKIDFDVMKF